MPLITLLTDFGSRDAFVGIMKGVILKISPEINIIDLTHGIQPQEVGEGAFILSSAYPFFPDGTIHICVVDPGVGSKRRAIIIETEKYVFVGPDNGIFAYVYLREPNVRVISITQTDYMLPQISNTFHGRDIFASVAAHIANGVPISRFGPEVTDYHTGLISIPVVKDNIICARVLHIDHYGNIITNVGKSLFTETTKNKKFQIRLAAMTIDRIRNSYDEVNIGSFLAIWGSVDQLEIAVNKGNAAKLIGVLQGDPVEIRIEN